jgi:hypothetical protein
MTKSANPFKLLCNKQIIAILDGDEKFGEIPCEDGAGAIENSMPHLSGSALRSISNRFGLHVADDSKSRWVYLCELMNYCIREKSMSNLLGHLFSKEQFSEKLRDHSPAVIEQAHRTIIETAIEQINKKLYFSGNKLQVAGEQFYIRPIGSAVTVAAPAIKKIDRNYIKGLSERAMKDIDEGNFDSALTKARTLLEEVFCYVIEKKSNTPSEKGNIKELYNQVKSLYNMHSDKHADERILALLSGLEQIIIAIAQMRNKDGDAHGVGAKRINISDYYARLCLNSATTTADFILSVSEKAISIAKD